MLEIMFIWVIVFTYFVFPLLSIVILAKSKRIGTVKKILLSILIVVVFFMITEGLLVYGENYINQHMSDL